MDVRDLFPREVRERAAGEPFDRYDPKSGATVRDDGRCVVGALLHEAGLDAPNTPSRSAAATLVAVGHEHGPDWWAVWDVLDALMDRNDEGTLRTPAAVRAALLPEETQP